MSEQEIQPRKKPSRKAFLPVLGLVFAVLLLAVSYGLAPLVLESVGMINDEWDAKIRVDQDLNNEIAPEFEYVIMFVLWLALMGVAALFVAVAIGEDPERESIKNLPASPANRKAVEKQLKRDLRDAKRRARKNK